MANILQTINNFVTLSYSYIVDSTNNVSKQVSINSNTVPLNLVASGNTIKTSASIQYSYTVNPADSPKTTLVNSALVETIFGSIATLAGSTKTVSTQYADIGDNISYAVKVVNNGTVDANSVVFSDTLPQGITFVAGTIKIDGVPISDPNANPTTGFDIGVVPAGISRTVTFSVKVTAIPTSNNIGNIASFSYNFLMNPNDPNSSEQGTDTTGSAVVTVIAHANLSTASTVVDKKAALIGQILTYTTTIPNTGNADANNVVFNEYIPDQTQLVPGSISAIVNGTPVSSIPNGTIADTTVNVNLGTIPVGTNAVVVFKVQILTEN